MEIETSGISRAGYGKMPESIAADNAVKDPANAPDQSKDDSAANDVVGNNSGVSLQDSVDEINSMIQSQNRSLQFSVDDSTETPVISVMDSDTGKVIREIPSEEVRALASRIKDLQDALGQATGVMLNKTA
ncbi:flagellar protein FlaG [Pokkaliibacter sp. CJK22405]|uniref:flagellar protein FlaG n=1 Tax=Pokkaliibacter sp. CJK22405 TaxID=3384615 RepID=UPI003984C016